MNTASIKKSRDKEDITTSQAKPEKIKSDNNTFIREKNKSDGSEFLDDRIRMKEQPLAGTGPDN